MSKFGRWVKEGFIVFGKDTKWLLWDHFAKYVLWNKPKTPLPNVSHIKRARLKSTVVGVGLAATLLASGAGASKISNARAERRSARARIEHQVQAQEGLMSMQEHYGWVLKVDPNSKLWEIPRDDTLYNDLAQNPAGASDYAQFLRGFGSWFEKLGVGTGRDENVEFTPARDPAHFIDAFNAEILEHEQEMLDGANEGAKGYGQYLIWTKQREMLGKIAAVVMSGKTPSKRFTIARQMAVNIAERAEMVRGIQNGNVLVQTGRTQE